MTRPVTRVKFMKIRIKKGYDLPLAGNVTDLSPAVVKVDRAAVYPDDFAGFIPKVAVKEGSTVAVGDPVLFDKNQPDIKIVSPLSGVVERVERGERRHIDRIIIRREGPERKATVDTTYDTPEEAIAVLARSGILAFIRRRPYDIIPDLSVRPRDIFVTCFDSAPLAVDPVWTADDLVSMQTAVDMLADITTGNVYISRRPESSIIDFKNSVTVEVSGPHPAGNAGVQAANIEPVSKGETVWTMSVNTLIRIGRLLRTSNFDASTTVAITGWGITSPYMACTNIGASVSALIDGRLRPADKHLRVISGNVLTGLRVTADDGYLRFPYTQLTVIPEGDDVDEFMGWASMSPDKLSLSPTYPGRLTGKLYTPDARINGGRRAIIMSGEYDRVLPMDILGEYLIKAIKSDDIDAMEKLGIYEVAPEDFALAEALDSSKQPLQAIVRSGLDYLRKELE